MQNSHKFFCPIVTNNGWKTLAEKIEKKEDNEGTVEVASAAAAATAATETANTTTNNDENKTILKARRILSLLE